MVREISDGPESVAAASPETMLVGYRLRVGHGEIAARAFDPHGRETELTRVTRGTAEIAALSRAAGVHVVPILDLGSTPRGDVVVVSPVVGHTIAELTTRAPFSAGQLVTLLVPVVQTVDRMHRSGVAHGGLGPAAIGIDDGGAPVLHSFGRAVLRDAPGGVGERVFTEVAAADDQAVVTTAAALLAAAGTAAVLLAARLAAEPVDAETLVRLLFELADPEPLLAPADPVLRRTDIVPARLLPATLPPVERRGPARATAAGGIAARLRAAIPAWLGPVRPRVWIAGAVSLLLLVAAVLLLPGRGAVAEGPTDRPASSASHPTPPIDRAVVPKAATLTSSPTAGDDSPDPLTAGRALLASRHDCIRRAMRDCLLALDQPGSPARFADSAGVGRAVVVDVAGARLRSSTRTVATLTAGDATVLIIRIDGRWLVRDVVGGG